MADFKGPKGSTADLYKFRDLDDPRLHGALNPGATRKQTIPSQASIDWRRVGNVDLLRMTMLETLGAEGKVKVLDGMTRLKGIVLRHEPMFGPEFARVHGWMNSEDSPPEFRSPPIKVRIPEIHTAIPAPKVIGPLATDRDSAMIDMHTTFVPVTDGVPKPKVGSIVWVGWENMKDLEGPLYFEPVAGINASIGIGSKISSMELFDSALLKAIEKTNVRNIDDEITIGSSAQDVFDASRKVVEDSGEV